MSPAHSKTIIYVRSHHARPASWVCLCSAPHVSSILPPVKQVVRSDLRYLLLFTLFKDIAARNSPRARCCATQVSAGAFLFLLPCQVEQDWTVEMLWVQCDFLIWKRQLLTDNWHYALQHVHTMEHTTNFCTRICKVLFCEILETMLIIDHAWIHHHLP